MPCHADAGISILTLHMSVCTLDTRHCNSLYARMSVYAYVFGDVQEHARVVAQLQASQAEAEQLKKEKVSARACVIRAWWRHVMVSVRAWACMQPGGGRQTIRNGG